MKSEKAFYKTARKVSWNKVNHRQPSKNFDIGSVETFNCESA